MHLHPSLKKWQATRSFPKVAEQAVGEAIPCFPSAQVGYVGLYTASQPLPKG